MKAYTRLESLERIGIKLGLRNIKAMLETLGNPERSYSSILIAGTNGKGSVGAMLNQILTQSGYLTGHYTSPHLIDIRERFRVGGVMIEKSEFDNVLTTVFEAVDKLTADQKLEAVPTYFETLTAAAMLHFKQKNVQFAVIEVGLGGRFDATNAITQTLSIITSIDYDHEEFLGKSLPEIAFEKAGIAKRNVPFVTGVLPHEADIVIEKAAAQLDCNLYRFEPEALSGLRLEHGFPVFEYVPWDTEVRVHLRGRHQAYNAGVALTTCNALSELGFEIPKSAALQGLETVEWAGRLDMLSTNPPVMLDCAHNAMGVRSLADFLTEIGWNQNITLFTAMKDKKIADMLTEIAPLTREMFLTRVEPRSRCASREQLEKSCKNLHISCQYSEELAEAYQTAAAKAANEGLPLVIFGSIYLAGEILKVSRRG